MSGRQIQSNKIPRVQCDNEKGVFPPGIVCRDPKEGNLGDVSA